MRKSTKQRREIRLDLETRLPYYMRNQERETAYEMARAIFHGLVQRSQALDAGLKVLVVFFLLVNVVGVIALKLAA